MTDSAIAQEKANQFRALHIPGKPLVMGNAWDAGSARILQGIGFASIATTSAGFAMTYGQRDYGVTREQSIAHASALADAVDIPVAADLENGFGTSVEAAVATITDALKTPIAGASIEDFSGDPNSPILDIDTSVQRIKACADLISRSENRLVLTARAEGFLHGVGTVDDIVRRLTAFAEAGADVVFAPGLPSIEAVRTVCADVDAPVSVMAYGPLAEYSYEELASAGVARISVGPALFMHAYQSMADAAKLMLQEGLFKA
ncbi:MAG: isocitrate lyase/phosphoenolpyruvate mutase family protein, partial [Pseudomonadota bacterium]